MFSNTSNAIRVRLPPNSQSIRDQLCGRSSLCFTDSQPDLSRIIETFLRTLLCNGSPLKSRLWLHSYRRNELIHLTSPSGHRQLGYWAREVYFWYAIQCITLLVIASVDVNFNFNFPWAIVSAKFSFMLPPLDSFRPQPVLRTPSQGPHSTALFHEKQVQV
jgi:hypothetical protein